MSQNFAESHICHIRDGEQHNCGPFPHRSRSILKAGTGVYHAKMCMSCLWNAPLREHREGVPMLARHSAAKHLNLWFPLRPGQRMGRAACTIPALRLYRYHGTRFSFAVSAPAANAPMPPTSTPETGAGPQHALQHSFPTTLPGPTLGGDPTRLTAELFAGPVFHPG